MFGFWRLRMLARCSLITVNDYLNYKVDFNLKKLFSNYEFNESIFKILKNIKIFDAFWLTILFIIVSKRNLFQGKHLRRIFSNLWAIFFSLAIKPTILEFNLSLRGFAFALDSISSKYFLVYRVNLSKLSILINYIVK